MVGDDFSNSVKETSIEGNARRSKDEEDKAKVISGDQISESDKTETFTREELESKKSKKKKTIDPDNIPNDIFLKLTEDLVPRNKETTLKDILKFVENGSRALIAGNNRVAIKYFQITFDLIPKSPTTVFSDYTSYIWVKYAFYISLIEVNSYAELLNALKLLQELQKALFEEIPVYYYAVAKILIKFHRFRLAEDEIQNCHNSIKHHAFKTRFWPETKEIIKETTKEGLLEYLEGLSLICNGYHKPDAICKFEGCISTSTHPYPSREIFTSDTDFKGYIIVTCQGGCKIQYHPLCWKNLKDTFSNLEKLSDKDCLGKRCITPDCKNVDQKFSVINKIEVIGSDGNIKSQCVQDHTAENKKKEIAHKKRQRLKSDEHKTDKPPNKNKPRVKKTSQSDQTQSSDNIASSMKTPTPKDNKPLQICGVTPVKSNIPIKNKETSTVEMNDLAIQKDIILSCFLVKVNSMGPLSKEKVEEEWLKIYPNIKGTSGLTEKTEGIFDMLKDSPNFDVVDNLLCAKEDKKSPAKEVSAPEVKTNIIVSNTVKVEEKQDWPKTNTELDTELREIEKELTANRVHSINMNHNPVNTNMMISHSLESVNNETHVTGSDRLVNMMNPFPPYTQCRPISHGYFEEYKSGKHSFPISNPITEVDITKGYNRGGIPPIYMSELDESRRIPSPWRGEGTGLPFGDLEQPLAKMAIRPPVKDPFSMHEPVFQKEMCIPTDATGEGKRADEEIWAQHLQLAFSGLLKKNKELMKSKEDMKQAHENEMEALRNQIHTLRSSYEEQIKALRENIARNFEEDRRMIALEQRMKLQEQILQCTKEELRKKDFDLLEAKRTLGTVLLERVEKESNRQVKRLVTALASMPCKHPDAEAVGRAMSKWELTGEHASKAKESFLHACKRYEAMLYDGFAMISLQDLVIPMVEEHAESCPLDNLIINLLQERENLEPNFNRSVTNAPPEIHPFRNKTQTLPSTQSPAPTAHTTIPNPIPLPTPSPVSAPLSPATLGARPREPLTSTANGESASALHSWPSVPSIQNSIHSLTSSTGTARALTNFEKLMIELRRCYPSRTEDELCNAVKAVRRKNKNSISGLSIERIVTMVGAVLEWWPEPSEGSMGLDKFMGWASDVVAPTEEFHGVSKVKSPAWITNSSTGKRDAEKEDCCICLQGISEPKTELTCSHFFHTQCIRKWLSKESVCPICRKFTRMPDEFPTLK